MDKNNLKSKKWKRVARNDKSKSPKKKIIGLSPKMGHFMRKKLISPKSQLTIYELAALTVGVDGVGVKHKLHEDLRVDGQECKKRRVVPDNSDSPAITLLAAFAK